MEYEIKNNLNFIFETCSSLNNILDKESMKNIKEEMVLAHPGQHKDIYRYFQIPEIIQEDLKATIDLTSDEAKLLFTQMDNIYIAHLFTEGVDKNTKEAELKKYILISCENASYPITDKGENKNLFEFITSLPHSVEMKYNLLEFCFNLEKYSNYFFSLVEKVKNVYKKYETLYIPIIEKFYEDISNIAKNDGFIEYIQRYLKFTVTDKSSTVEIYPSFSLSPSAISIEMTENLMRFYLGADFLNLSSIVDKNKEKSNKLSEYYKILSDPTKLQILNLLKTKEFYSAEIAKELNLTTATISHHMNTLLTNKFIGIRKEGNKVFYERDEEMINQIKDLIRDSF